VKLRFAGSAFFGADYVTAPSVSQRFNIMFPPGVSSTNVSIEPRLDSFSEGQELVDLVILEDQNYVTAPHRATVRIYDPPAGSNSPPTAGTDVILRYLPSFAAVETSFLLSNDNDPNEDPLTLDSVAASSLLGATVLRVGTTIYYVPPDGLTNDDSFTYTITDGRGASATGVVQVATRVVPSPTLTISTTNGIRFLAGTGIPGLGYRLEYKDSIPGPSWQTLTGITNNALGRFIFLESLPASSLRIFRLAFP
jgi:hypothetical protein